METTVRISDHKDCWPLFDYYRKAYLKLDTIEPPRIEEEPLQIEEQHFRRKPYLIMKPTR